MKKTIGVLAHVDAGKTTFCEQVLYHTQAIRSRGRVDLKNSFLDNHEIEKQRGITIFSEQAVFEYEDSKYYLIDTPGHIDFSPQMERAISIIDYAIVIISAVEKVQSHTKTVFRLLKKHNIPTIFFVNKIDRVGADVDEVYKDIKESLTKDVIDISDNLDLCKETDKISESMIEFIAERDDELFEKYLSDEYEERLWLDKFKSMIRENKIYPLLKGSALNDVGIVEFIEKLDYITHTEYNTEKDFLGKVYKVKHDENKNRITYIKALQGTLKVKDEITYKNNDEVIREKINSIKIYNSDKYEVVNEVSAGDIFAVNGITKSISTDLIYDINTDEKIMNDNIGFDMIPTLKSKVIFSEKLNIKEVLNAFMILDSEEPALNVLWNENLREIQIHVMGKIQLEILKDIVKSRFNIDVEFGKCEILYKESVKEKCIGYGHFEPLGHYAEVHLLIEPGDRNSNIEFKSLAHVDDISIGNQNLVRTHIFEKDHKGILGGFPLTDLKISLIIGRAHNKHTSGGDFREATLRALRQGLEQVENVILEPFYKFSIEIDLDNLGRVMSDITKKSGEFLPPIILENKAIVNGRGPVATFMDYSLEVVSFSRGNGSISFVFDGYDVCHNSQEVIENIGYNKDSDSEYTSNSIFCSKGQGYVVSSQDAKSHMHCIK